jgi:hypothetical protein
LNGSGDLLAGEGARKRRGLSELCRFLGLGLHDGDNAINGILFEEGPPLPPKGGRWRRPVSDVPLQIAPRQGENRLGIFLKLLRDQFMLRELDLIERFVRHGLSSSWNSKIPSIRKQAWQGGLVCVFTAAGIGRVFEEVFPSIQIEIGDRKTLEPRNY